MEILVLLISLMLVPLAVAATTINCTTNVCSWYAWGPWSTCTGSYSLGNQGTQKRDRRACCPEDLKVKTIAECLKECENTHPGKMKIGDSFINQTCTLPSTTTTTTTTTTPPPTTTTTPATTTTQNPTATKTRTTATSASKQQTATKQQSTTHKVATTKTTTIPTTMPRRKTSLTTLQHPSTGNPTTSLGTKSSSQTSQKGTSTKVSKHQAVRTDTKSSDSGGSAVPAAVGTTVGLLSLAGLSSCLGYLFWKRNKKNKEEKKVHPVTEESANGTPPAGHGI